MSIFAPRVTFRLKLWNLILRTRSVLRSRVTTGSRMSQLLGSWVWVFLLRRPCLSVFSACYDFMQKAGPRVYALPPQAVAELDTAVKLAPLVVVDMHSPFDGTILASDASKRGGGVTYACTTAGEAQIMAEQHGGNGWYTSLSPDYRSTKLEMPPDKIARVDALDWRTAISTRWNFDSHINVLEAQAVLLALRWYISSRQRLHTRVPILVDSSSVVGALSKGRSSSRRLLRQCRRIAALCLAADIRPYYVWVPTAHNPADAPSRRA